MIAGPASGYGASFARASLANPRRYMVRALDTALGSTLILMRFSPVEIALIKESAGLLTGYARPTLKGLQGLGFGRAFGRLRSSVVRGGAATRSLPRAHHT
jgi:hypothetical protein